MPKKRRSAPETAQQPLKQLQEFYRYMVEQRLESMEYDAKDMHIRLVRQRPEEIPVPVAMGVAAAPAASPADAETPCAPAAAPAPGASTIKAPMIGIFYRANSPSSPPFVKANDAVKKGRVLCLIEAMKVFNEVKADFDCTIMNILVENGKPVKAGQDIFVVKK